MMSWLLLFLLHSTLWCGLTWLWLRVRPATHARVREILWTTALAASLLTPTVQTLWIPDSALWSLPTPELGESVGVIGESRHGEAHEAGQLAWTTPVYALWFTIAAVLLAVHGSRLLHMRNQLQLRDPVEDSHARQALESLGQRARLATLPRLSESHVIGTPIAIGWGRRKEICVPIRALHELDRSEFSALLGHELAHHVRQDVLRLGILSLLQSLFFFQPLFRLAVRELHLAAEEQCDDWAARHIDDPLAMASCLTEAAAWVMPRDRGLPVPCMGRRRSHFARRVTRLMEDRPFENSSAKHPYLVAIGALAASTWLAPGLVPSPVEEFDRYEGGAEHREHSGKHAEVPREHDRPNSEAHHEHRGHEHHHH